MQSGHKGEQKKWNVLYTRSRHEQKCIELIARLGIEALCPTIKTKRQWSDRIKKISVPLFPSYVFVKLSEKERQSVVNVPGVVKFVSWEGRPAEVSQREMKRIQELQGREGEVEILELNHLAKGEIDINSGHFKGFKGKIDQRRSRSISVIVSELNARIVFKYEVA